MHRIGMHWRIVCCALMVTAPFVVVRDHAWEAYWNDESTRALFKRAS